MLKHISLIALTLLAAACNQRDPHPSINSDCLAYAEEGWTAMNPNSSLEVEQALHTSGAPELAVVAHLGPGFNCWYRKDSRIQVGEIWLEKRGTDRVHCVVRWTFDQISSKWAPKQDEPVCK